MRTCLELAQYAVPSLSWDPGCVEYVPGLVHCEGSPFTVKVRRGEAGTESHVVPYKGKKEGCYMASVSTSEAAVILDSFLTYFTPNKCLLMA